MPTTSSPARTRLAFPGRQASVRWPDVSRRSETATEAASTRRLSNRSIVSARLCSGPAAAAGRAASPATPAQTPRKARFTVPILCCRRVVPASLDSQLSTLNFPTGIQSFPQSMALQPGTRLGSFEILDPLGKGGMGEVYRARDTRLGRDVAIKVLPETFAKDPQRLARFERDARR